LKMFSLLEKVTFSHRSGFKGPREVAPELATGCLAPP
jgi:hypothetical protein